VNEEGRRRLLAGMAGLKERAKTLLELAESAAFYVRPRPLALDDKALKQVAGDGAGTLAMLHDRLAHLEPWTREALEADARAAAEAHGLKLGKVAQPLRAAVTGSTVSPPIFEVMEILGRAETLARLEDCRGG
jgi:glutamyl-tRNA synthetase